MNNTYFYVYSSANFTDGNLVYSVKAFNFSIGSVQERKIFSFVKLKDIEMRYSYEYDQLKEYLGVPPIYDFAILAPRIGINMLRTSPTSVDVMAKDYIYEVLNESDGKIINTRFTVKVW